MYKPLEPETVVCAFVSSCSLKDGIISQGTTIPSITPLDNAPATAGTGIPTGVAPKPSNILVITLVGPRIFIPFKSAADFITFSLV